MTLHLNKLIKEIFQFCIVVPAQRNSFLTETLVGLYTISGDGNDLDFQCLSYGLARCV